MMISGRESSSVDPNDSVFPIKVSTCVSHFLTDTDTA